MIKVIKEKLLNIETCYCSSSTSACGDYACYLSYDGQYYNVNDWWSHEWGGGSCWIFFLMGLNQGPWPGPCAGNFDDNSHCPEIGGWNRVNCDDGYGGYCGSYAKGYYSGSGGCYDCGEDATSSDWGM